MSNILRTMMRAMSEPVAGKPSERPRRRVNDAVKTARAKAPEARRKADARKVARKSRQTSARQRPALTNGREFHHPDSGGAGAEFVMRV